MNSPGYVYFIRCGQYVKIGWSFLPEARKRELETGNPHDCVLEGMHVGTQLDERRMHRYFRSLHHRGEWFRWCIDIENVAKNGLPQLIHGRRVDLRLGAHARKTARGPFEIRRSMENVVAFPTRKKRLPQTEFAVIEAHLAAAATAAMDHVGSGRDFTVGVTLNTSNPHEELASFLRLQGRKVQELSAAADVTGRNAANAIAGRPVAAVPYLRLCAASGFDPMPELPLVPTLLSDFDFQFLGAALNTFRTLRQHTERDAAQTSGLSLASISRIENGHSLSIPVIIRACRYLCTHPTRYLKPVSEAVSHETVAETTSVVA